MVDVMDGSRQRCRSVYALFRSPYVCSFDPCRLNSFDPRSFPRSLDPHSLDPHSLESFVDPRLLAALRAH